MKKSKIQSLTVKVVEAVKPPLKRGELVEALARKFIQEVADRKTSLTAKYNAAETELFGRAKTLMLNPENWQITDEPDVGFSYNSNSREYDRFYCTIRASLSPEVMKPLMSEAAALFKLSGELKAVRVPDLSSAKAIIREKLDGTPVDRVGAALNDPETSKALGLMLVALNKPKQLTIHS